MTTGADVQTFIFPGDVDSAVSQTECEKLYELAAGRVVLELGSWHGRSAIAMAQSAVAVHCVDHFLGDHHAGFGATLSSYFDNTRRYGLTSKIVTHVGTFEDVLPVFQPDHFGLVFCDGLHTREATDLQLEWAVKLSAYGGVVAFHDYSDAYQEEGFCVRPVVDEFAKWMDLELGIVDTLAVLHLP